MQKNEVKYLGNIINNQGIRPDVSRTMKLKNFMPKNKKDLQKILGLINWFRPFIKNLSTRLAGLYDKLQKENKFQWNQQDTTLINEIFSEINKQVMLNYPDFNKSFILETDASNSGIGAVLYQEKLLIGFFSYKFKKSEQNYTIVEKETFAILKSLIHFKQIVFNSKIIIKTDNNNLIFNSPLTTRIQRWKLQLSEYDYELIYNREKTI